MSADTTESSSSSSRRRRRRSKRGGGGWGRTTTLIVWLVCLVSCCLLCISLVTVGAQQTVGNGSSGNSAGGTASSRPRRPIIWKEQYGPLDVYFEDLHLMVRGREFFVKGVSYSPFPLGVQHMGGSVRGGGGSRAVGRDYGGGGLCSAKQTIFGEHKSACFGSDMFDGVQAHPDRDPPGPTGPWWGAVWERDFAVMQELGINTVRVYNLNPYTRHLLETRPDIVPDATNPELGAQHLPFMDYAHKCGLKVILPIVTDETMLTRMSDFELNALVESQVEELGNHPALLAFLVGNELNLRGNPTLLRRVNRMMSKVRQYTFWYWGRVVPVSTALIDDPTSYNWYIAHLDVDFFTINVFRSTGLATLFERDSSGRFAGWAAASKRHRLPVLLGEFGEHSQLALTERIPDWFNQQWKAIVDNMDRGLVGAVFFEYSDEPFTKVDADQRDMGIVLFEPAVDRETNRSSTEPDVWVPDRVVKKEVIFEAVAHGLPDSAYAQYNMNADVWQLSGREPKLSRMYDGGNDGNDKEEEQEEGEGGGSGDTSGGGQEGHGTPEDGPSSSSSGDGDGDGDVDDDEWARRSRNRIPSGCSPHHHHHHHPGVSLVVISVLSVLLWWK